MSHQAHERAAADLRVGIALLTLSDTRTPATDKSGQTMRRLLEAAGHEIVDAALIRDEPAALRDIMSRWLADAGIDAILTTGGTGLSRRDQTIPVLESMIATPLPGFGELFRMLSHAQIGSAAMLSRATAGISESGKLIAALPGSAAAVELAISQLLVPQLRHIVAELRK